MDDYLARPVRMGQLRSVLNRGLAPNADEVPAPAAAQVTKDRPALDRDVIAKLREEEDNLLVELIDLFNTEVPAQLQELAGALARRDTKTAASIGHTLKGTAGTLGANRMCELAASIDQAARDGLVDPAVAMLEQLRPEIDRVRGALEIERTK